MDHHPGTRDDDPSTPITGTRAVAGFRRVESVHIHTRGGHAVAEVTGVLHRYPRTVTVSLATAARLAAAGAPVRIDGPHTESPHTDSPR